MSTPTLNVRGLLFMSKAKPALTETSTGKPQLTLTAVHRIASHQTEPWRLVWVGDEAKAFFDTHRDQLVAGQPIHFEASQLRTYAVGWKTEIVAHVMRIDIHHPERAGGAAPHSAAHQD